MAETGAPEVETLTLGEFSRTRGIDSALLRLLAEGGHITSITKRSNSYRFPANHPLTAAEATAKGRHAYDETLEAVGRFAMKTQSRMRRLLAEIEDQQDHLDDVIPLGPGLQSAVEDLRGHDQVSRETIIAVYELIAWNRVVCNVAEARRIHAETDGDAEMVEQYTVPLRDQMDISRRPPHNGPRERPTSLADELPDGVDDLSPMARRTVLDLLRVLVVAETGNEPR
ncbi:hypothetical protein [Kocuria aegyptia]|uniref:Uncharacterized protein n=1 Tax=Kocuria aegyptia TaxID=330943 RepID=A0ABN2K363_9MICC